MTETNSKDAKNSEDAANDYVSIFGRKVKKADLFKLGGLVLFVVLIGGIVALLWPSLSQIFQPDGIDRVIESIKSQGVLGALILLGVQFVQIVVAFIPGEAVQVAAGMLYGPVLGSLLILVGCIISSAVIYQIVHSLGAPFVRDMVSKEHLEKFYEFERSGKLSLIVFVLFLIPAMPKDVFTYLVPLTSMRLRTFLLLTTIGRIPGVIVSTYAAAGLAEGDIKTSLIIFAVAAVIVIICIIFRNRIMRALGNTSGYMKAEHKREELAQKKAEHDLKRKEHKEELREEITEKLNQKRKK